MKDLVKDKETLEIVINYFFLIIETCNEAKGRIKKHGHLDTIYFFVRNMQ